MEYLIGPVIAAALSITLTEKRYRTTKNRIDSMQSDLELISNKIEYTENELPKRMLSTLLPVAKEVTKIKTVVGL
tara:strand:+ start:299 stop:523 length:225 start_codon:yes stop_codon:yes gene_type:complete